jgi:hypothetical protein
MRPGWVSGEERRPCAHQERELFGAVLGEFEDGGLGGRAQLRAIAADRYEDAGQTHGRHGQHGLRHDLQMMMTTTTTTTTTTADDTTTTSHHHHRRCVRGGTPARARNQQRSERGRWEAKAART